MKILPNNPEIRYKFSNHFQSTIDLRYYCKIIAIDQSNKQIHNDKWGGMQVLSKNKALRLKLAIKYDDIEILTDPYHSSLTKDLLKACVKLK